MKKAKQKIGSEHSSREYSRDKKKSFWRPENTAVDLCLACVQSWYMLSIIAYGPPKNHQEWSLVQNHKLALEQSQAGSSHTPSPILRWKSADGSIREAERSLVLLGKWQQVMLGALYLCLQGFGCNLIKFNFRVSLPFFCFRKSTLLFSLAMRKTNYHSICITTFTQNKQKSFIFQNYSWQEVA